MNIIMPDESSIVVDEVLTELDAINFSLGFLLERLSYEDIGSKATVAIETAISSVLTSVKKSETDLKNIH